MLSSIDLIRIMEGTLFGRDSGDIVAREKNGVRMGSSPFHIRERQETADFFKPIKYDGSRIQQAISKSKQEVLNREFRTIHPPHCNA